MNDRKLLLKRVRAELLALKAGGSTGFGLSYITRLVSNGSRRDEQKNRGHVQWCLAQLAISGLLYSRTRPEPAVPMYAHGETDKRFRFRIAHKKKVADA
jgi:hypothetical protein